MERLTNEEKAQEIAKRYKTPCQGFGDCEFEAYQSALEAMEWKDEQFKEMLQALPKSVQDLIVDLSSMR